MSPRSLRSSLRRHSRHRLPRRSPRVALAMLILGTASLASVGAPSAGAASPAVVVPAATCMRFDPNLGSGACLKYQARSGVAYTWIGTYRASNGAPFYCIDYLYDSRISASAARVSTVNLRNQLDRPVGAAEVAALNYLISTRAPNGSAGSADADAAIALIIREVMGDGIRNDGTIVYPPGLKVHGAVQTLPGGMPTRITSLAQTWWNDASVRRGPWTVRLTPKSPASTVPLGQSAGYQLSLTSADARAVSGVVVTFSCTGPVTCPDKLTTAATPSTVTVVPQGLGAYTITAAVNGPSAQGQLLKGAWATHGGTTAIDNGVQRGWIAQRVSASASAGGAAVIVKATPTVITQAPPTATPGTALTDVVTVSGLPSGYHHPMTATLYGPFGAAPTATSCTPDKVIGSTTVDLQANGPLRTPSIETTAAGYYVWTESLPGDERTIAVDTPCGVAEETTLIKARPTVSTRVAGARAGDVTTLRDAITVRDAGDIGPAGASMAWSLLGPVTPTDAGCADLDWSKAPVLQQGSVAVAGDGRYVTPDSVVRSAGCYTYVESLPASTTSEMATTAPGAPTETVLVRDWPRFHTVVSTSRTVVPGRVVDTIVVAGLSSGGIDVRWSLLGPLAPGRSRCSGLDWSRAPIRANGTVRAGNGRVSTPPVSLTVAGCYTFREHSGATATAAEADSAAGLPAETVLATRRALRVVPEVPTGPVSPVGGWWTALAGFWR